MNVFCDNSCDSAITELQFMSLVPQVTKILICNFLLKFWKTLKYFFTILHCVQISNNVSRDKIKISYCKGRKKAL